MGFLISETHQKEAFRVAYNFLDKHPGDLCNNDEYKAVAADLYGAIVTNRENPLACRLLSAVYDFICATSQEHERNRMYDAKGTAEGS